MRPSAAPHRTRPMHERSAQLKPSSTAACKMLIHGPSMTYKTCHEKAAKENEAAWQGSQTTFMCPCILEPAADVTPYLTKKMPELTIFRNHCKACLTHRTIKTCAVCCMMCLPSATKAKPNDTAISAVRMTLPHCSTYLTVTLTEAQESVEYLHAR